MSAESPSPPGDDRVSDRGEAGSPLRSATDDESAAERAAAYAVHPMSSALEDTATPTMGTIASKPGDTGGRAGTRREQPMSNDATTEPGSQRPDSRENDPAPDVRDQLAARSEISIGRASTDSTPGSEMDVERQSSVHPGPGMADAESQEMPFSRSSLDLDPAQRRKLNESDAPGADRTPDAEGAAVTGSTGSSVGGWPTRADHPDADTQAVSGERVKVTTAHDSGDSDAALYVDAGEDLERVGATSGMAPGSDATTRDDTSKR